MSLPTSGNLSIKSAAGSTRCIACEVDGNETGNKNLTTLANSANISLPVAITDFYGYSSFSISPEGTKYIGFLGSAANSYYFNLTITTGSSWTISENDPNNFIEPQTTSGTGNATVKIYSRSTNTNQTSYRQASITVTSGGTSKTVNIYQDKYPDGYLTVDSSCDPGDSNTDIGTFSVDAQTGSWQLYSGDNLISITSSPTSGTGQQNTIDIRADIGYPNCDCYYEVTIYLDVYSEHTSTQNRTISDTIDIDDT